MHHVRSEGKRSLIRGLYAAESSLASAVAVVRAHMLLTGDSVSHLFHERSTRGDEYKTELRRRFRAAASAASILFGCASQPSGSGWITLIDGTSGMENWNATGSNANWRAEDGAILADKSTGKESSVLVSKRSFRDFHLYVEFWASEDTNSGIYIRIMNPNQVSTATGAYKVRDLGQEPESGLCDRQPRERRVRESDPQGRRPLEYVRNLCQGTGDHGQAEWQRDRERLRQEVSRRKNRETSLVSTLTGHIPRQPDRDLRSLGIKPDTYSSGRRPL